MRLVSTIVLCVLILGGTWLYLDVDSGIKRAAAEVNYAKAAGVTKVKIDRTFECFDNSAFGEPALKVSFGGTDVFVNDAETLSPETAIEFEIDNVEQLENSLTIYANATSPDSFGDDAPPLRAMMVTVTYDEQVVAEKVFHAGASAISIGGNVTFRIPASSTHEDHSH